jgi:hypothetical protein
MTRCAPTLASLLLLLSLAACGAVPTQNFDHSSRAGIKHVYLLPVGMPEHARVQIMNPIGAGFGLAGNFIESRRAAGAGQEMQSTLAAAHYDFRNALRNSLAAAVGKVGFALTRVPGERPDRERARFLPKYPPVKRADAFLDVYVTYVGFEAPQSSTDYRPRLEIAARLVRARDSHTLFQDRIVYGYVENADAEADIIRADDRLSFRNRASLQADPNRTARALQSAIDAISWELARQFM